MLCVKYDYCEEAKEDHKYGKEAKYAARQKTLETVHLLF
jgi:hypothetical protein